MLWRLLSGVVQPGEGINLLGRWHKADLSGGFTLVECNDPVAAYTDAAKWADVMDLSIVPVLEDAEIGPILAAQFKQ